MGSAKGAETTAAKRIGVTVEEYRARVAGGEKWCHRGAHWVRREGFTVDRSRSDGLSAVCRGCRRTTKGPGQREHDAKRAEGFGWCRTCQEWKPFGVMARTQCRPCVNRERRERYANDPEFRHRLRSRVYQRKRSISDVPPEGAEFLTEKFEGQCAYCGDPADTWDHIVPVSAGGRTTPGNILPACRSCNSSKGNRDVWDWMEEKGVELSDTLVDRLVFQHVSLFG